VRLGLSEGQREALSLSIAYGAGTLLFLLVLQINGLDLGPLMVLLGGLGVGIGFGLQEITKNLVSGLTLLAEGKLRVGDLVEFEGLTGYIKEISVRSTIVRTLDGADVVVPNSDLTGRRILNWSYKDLSGKLRLPFSVAYRNDSLLVTETLLDCAYREPSVLHEPPPKVIFKGFGANSMEFELWVWVARIDEGITIASSLYFMIDESFRRVGLTMSMPQQELRMTVTADGKPIASADSPASSPTVSIRESLRHLPPFNICSDTHLRRLIETGYRKRLGESEILFNEGERGRDFYLVLSGAVETVPTRLDKQIKVYGAGELMGEVPVVLGIPYLVTARSLEETSLFVIRESEFAKLLPLYPDLAETFALELTKEKEIYLPVRQHLEELGLLDMNEREGSFIAWARSRLKKIFS
jgi:potassium-dependent mechanosensitive channel